MWIIHLVAVPSPHLTPVINLAKFEQAVGEHRQCQPNAKPAGGFICRSWNGGKCHFPRTCYYQHVCSTCRWQKIARALRHSAEMVGIEAESASRWQGSSLSHQASNPWWLCRKTESYVSHSTPSLNFCASLTINRIYAIMSRTLTW